MIVRKPKGRLKFESFDALKSYLRNIGAAYKLDDIVTLETRSSKDAGLSHGRKEMQDRVLMWWNESLKKPDMLSQRPSYVLTYMLREAVKKRSG